MLPCGQPNPLARWARGLEKPLHCLRLPSYPHQSLGRSASTGCADNVKLYDVPPKGGGFIFYDATPGNASESKATYSISTRNRNAAGSLPPTAAQAISKLARSVGLVVVDPCNLSLAVTADLLTPKNFEALKDIPTETDPLGAALMLGGIKYFAFLTVRFSNNSMGAIAASCPATSVNPMARYAVGEGASPDELHTCVAFILLDNTT